MATQTQKNHKILVAVGLGGRSCALGMTPGFTWPLLLGDDRAPDPEEGLPSLGYPTVPGLYVWFGDIDYYYYDTDDWTFEARGQWRPATPEDVHELLGKGGSEPQEEIDP